MHVRKGDTVIVIAGNDKGKKGAITRVQPVEGRVVVEGVNLRWKHKKPTQKVGILADVEVKPTIAGIRDGRDELLEEALRQIAKP